MYIDKTDLEDAIRSLPEEAWDGWSVARIADWIFDYASNPDVDDFDNWSNEGGQ